MKNILFPTDFSPAADHAFIYALEFARHCDCTITTVHVYERPDVSGITQLPPSLAKVYDNLDLQALEDYRESIPHLREMADAHGYQNMDIKHLMKEGRVVDAIIETAREAEADLIIMGTTGARGLKEIFLGSVAGEVLENAHCPVLAVPKDATFDGRINRIAFTTSFADEEKIMLRRLQSLTLPFLPKIFCVNVDLSHTESITQRMTAFGAEFEEDNRFSFDVIDGTDIKAALIDFMDDHHIDILAMVSHKRSFLDELFNYSRAKMMSYHSNTPVMALPATLV